MQSNKEDDLLDYNDLEDYARSGQHAKDKSSGQYAKDKSSGLNKHRVYRVRANRKSHDIPLEA